MHLQTELDRYSELTDRQQITVMHLIWMSIDPTRRHRKDPKAFYVEAAAINKLFGRNPLFFSKNLELTYFITNDRLNSDNPKESRTYAYKLYPYTTGKALQSFLEKDVTCQTDLIVDDGKRIITPPSAIRSRTKQTTSKKAGNSKWIGSSLKSLTPVNIEALTAFKQTLIELREQVTQGPQKEKLTEIFNVTAKTLILARNTVADSHLITQYEQAVSGRLYAIGFSLQSAYKLVRQAALAGQWDYDISNAHYSILNQLAARAGYTCTAIPYYLANKKAVREDLAKSTQITVEDIKTILISLIYGAKADHPSIGAVAELIDDPVKTRLLQNHPIFQELVNDTQQAFKSVLAAQPKGPVVNAMGSAESRSKHPRSLASHLLQGVEARALKAVVDCHGPVITLCVHDGWCSSERLDVETLEKSIQSATGMTLRVEEAQMEIPPLNAILTALQRK